ncbi:MAG: glycosyltransferase [Bacteroidales bacterium]|nr:glycosyltransferase [Bacteroidales bacterium]
MKLSIVIVNYNVRHFLEQCLQSVRVACQGIEAEVFVVDNASADGSVRMVRERFPEVQLISNEENVGFSRANNQAIRLSSGQYVLLLNPDTVVEDDTFSAILRFMDGHPEAGSLGVKMVDGTGRFLPESKRSLPTPAVAFYKIFGLSRLFPKSRTFGKYHLGYLNPEETHEVEILSGAFMFLRKEALDKAGLLDEEFFMYGEDIDLSYRIIKAGYRNYYFPGARIIHYKGESTKKGSANYVYTFYQAMNIFARKHFSQRRAWMFTLLINLAVYLRAGMALASRWVKRMALPVLEALVIYAGIFLTAQWWEANILIGKGGTYPEAFYLAALPAYILLWLACIYLGGGYDRPYRIRRALGGVLAGTLLILVIYALLPESLRFSRAIILLGSVWGLLSTAGLRYLLRMGRIPGFAQQGGQSKHILIIGEKEEGQRIELLLNRAMVSPAFSGLVSPKEEEQLDPEVLGPLNRIRDMISIYKINEVIFCARNLSASKIIDLMAELQDTGVEYKIAPQESMAVIGSNSIRTSGELYVIDVNTISRPENMRMKRLFDLTIAGMLLFLTPVLSWAMHRPAGLVPNLWKVITGNRSLIGYIPTAEHGLFRLPRIRRGLLNPADAFPGMVLGSHDHDRLNMLYAKNYSIGTDLEILWKAFRSLGRREQKP